MSIDSDKLPIAVLLQGDDVDNSYCDDCGLPASEWPRDTGYHPGGSRPGAMVQAALYCADCKPRSYNDDGLEVRTFCGMRHRFTDGEQWACGCFS